MKNKFDNQFEDADIFILNYETLKNDKVVEKLKEKNIETILVDEIHTINNHTSARSKAIYQFNDLKYIVGATATPITNNPENLFGIFNLIDKDLFNSYTKFSKNYIKYAGYGRVAGVKNEEHLKNKIQPYIFIKSEEDVADQLPQLIVTQKYCEMPDNMLELNNYIFEELDKAREDVDTIEKHLLKVNKGNTEILLNDEAYLVAKGKVMAYQTFLQELVDDPRLLANSESNMAQSYICTDISPKLNLLIELVDEILNAGNKVCIFTKYARMQSILKECLENTFNINCAIVNGSMSAEERYEQAYTLFSDNDNYKILIGTDAMSEGISLNKCNYLIEYDLADSYAIQTQRHGRIKRANSIHKTSYVYQIICYNSYDEIQAKIIAKKEDYDNNLIKSLN